MQLESIHISHHDNVQTFQTVHKPPPPLPLCCLLTKRPRKTKKKHKHNNSLQPNATCRRDHTRPSYKESAETMVSSRLLPSLNSAMSNDPFSSLSIIRNILRTRFSGVSSSSGSLTMDPTWINRGNSDICREREQGEISEGYTDHFVDCFHNLQHLLVADFSVSVDVI